MMGIDLTQLNDVSVGALLVLVILLILSGRLVPRRILQDTQKERDTWRASAELSAQQVQKLVDKDDAVLAMLRSIERKAIQQTDVGEDHLWRG